VNTTKGKADNNDLSNMPTQAPSESSHSGTADSQSVLLASSTSPAPYNAIPVEEGSQQLDDPLLMLDDPPLMLDEPLLMLDDSQLTHSDPLAMLSDPLLILNEHNNSLGNFCSSSQALLSLGYDSKTTIAY